MYKDEVLCTTLSDEQGSRSQRPKSKLPGLPPKVTMFQVPASVLEVLQCGPIHTYLYFTHTFILSSSICAAISCTNLRVRSAQQRTPHESAVSNQEGAESFRSRFQPTKKSPLNLSCYSVSHTLPPFFLFFWCTPFQSRFANLATSCLPLVAQFWPQSKPQQF